MTDSDQPASSSRGVAAFLRAHWPFLLLLAYLGVVFDSILLSVPGIFEPDGYYHARYSEMLPERGISRQFPWMQFTTWTDRFADKDFLYHVLLAPFCTNHEAPLNGAKFGTVVFALFSITAFYVVLRKLRVPWAVAWTALLFVGSSLFLNRLLMIRSHVFSISLMMIATYAILQRRVWWCFFMGFLYAWSYSFPIAMLITAVLLEAGFFISVRDVRKSIRIIAASAAGIIAGLAINPYTPYSFVSVWQFINISTSMRGGIELGSEFRPIDIRGACVVMPGMIAALAYVAKRLPRIILGSAKPTIAPMTAAVCVAAFGWFGACFYASRMVEYFAPVAVLAAALVFRDVDFPKLSEALPELRRFRIMATALPLALVIATLHGWSDYLLRLHVKEPRQHSNKQDRYFDDASAWMKQNISAKSTVLNFHWDDFVELFYLDTQHYFVVGLDPTFMRLPYPEHAETLEQMRTGKTPLDLARLRSLFRCEYMIMRNYRAAKFPELKRGDVRPAYADDFAVIYKLPEK